MFGVHYACFQDEATETDCVGVLRLFLLLCIIFSVFFIGDFLSVFCQVDVKKNEIVVMVKVCFHNS